MLKASEPTVSGEADEKLEEFFLAFAKAGRALLLLDYDGTLAPFRVDRFQARPWAGIRPLLARIQSLERPAVETRIAIITGRPAAEIAPLLGLTPALEVWGLHGAERLFADGRRELEEIPAATRAKLDELRQQLSRSSFGGLFEDKANAVVMHWRGAAPGKAREIERRTRTLFEPLTHLKGVTLLEFESGLELRTGRHKGQAAEALLNEVKLDAAGAICPVAFLGDDVTDEEAFRAVNSAAGPHLTALVRREPRSTAADIWLKPPLEVKSFLEKWIAAGNREDTKDARRSFDSRRSALVAQDDHSIA